MSPQEAERIERRPFKPGCTTAISKSRGNAELQIVEGEYAVVAIEMLLRGRGQLAC
jgi:hypothetical protein